MQKWETSSKTQQKQKVGFNINMFDIWKFQGFGQQIYIYIFSEHALFSA